MSATATHVPARETCDDRWLDSAPDTVAASETAPMNINNSPASTATPASRAIEPTPAARSATPHSAPAGTHAATSRRAGWPSVPSSCCNGSAPATSGPYANTPAPRSRYSQPVAPATTMTTNSHAATVTGRGLR